MTGEPSGAVWRDHPATRAVMELLDGASGKARFVGGCVRNTLLGRPVSDIDIATTLHPEETARRLDRAGIKVVLTGLKHGTVTAVMAGRHFEITTLRRDVETDGRHARVAFTDDWAGDAARRDFTMNALFMDAAGRLYDPIGGRADLEAGRVRFIGDPRQRIAEDALRVLRFFRFQAEYGRTAPDGAGLAACRAMAGTLTALSGERIRAELLKLLAAPGAVGAVAAMRDADILQPLFPGPLAAGPLTRLIELEDDCPDALRRLAVLLPAPASCVAERLRLSRVDRGRLAAMSADRLSPDADDRALRAQIYQLGRERFRDAAFVSAAFAPERDPEPWRRMLALAASWSPPAFPLRGADLRGLGVPEGDRLGRVLKQVEARWIAEDFNGGHAACLAWARGMAAADGGKEQT